MKTVLIVDDEKNIRSSLATTFRLGGYRVEVAEDVDEALHPRERQTFGPARGGLEVGVGVQVAEGGGELHSPPTLPAA